LIHHPIPSFSALSGENTGLIPAECFSLYDMNILMMRQRESAYHQKFSMLTYGAITA
jgi:hypothetical protein